MIDSDLLRFLSFPIYRRDEHPRRWDKYAYDEEFVHYAMLGLLLEESVNFRQAFLPETENQAVRVVGPIPGTCPFDLEVRKPDKQAVAFIKVKTWAPLSDNQFEKQTAHLQAVGGCRGYYLLSPKQLVKWSSARIERESQGMSRCITFAEVLDATRLVCADESVSGIVSAYASVIEELIVRTSESAA